VLALISLFLVWFGGAPIGIYLYIIFSIAMMMVVATVNAIQNVHPIYIQFAQTLGASRGKVFRTVVLPAIMPELFGGIRVAVGIAWGNA
jgi:ABC-type nitrate/sulfonate/bicarbonate transport system permease component